MTAKGPNILNLNSYTQSEALDSGHSIPESQLSDSTAIYQNFDNLAR